MSATENFADNKSLLLTIPALILTAVCSILPFGKAEAGACPPGSCMPGCAECSCEDNWQTCDRCQSSHARVRVSGNQYQCFECGENERVSSDGSSCVPTKCADGYAIDPALGCVSCSTIDPSCVSCDTATDCTGCADGYAVSLNDDKCYACSGNCSTCGYDDTNHKITECTACKNGFRFSSKNNGSCVAEVPNCATYNNKDKCDTCAEGYVKKGGECVTSCGDGYVVDASGWNCVQGIANCDTYGPQGYDGGCFGCASGYVVDKVGNIGKCMPEASCNGNTFWVVNGECIRKTCSEAFGPDCLACNDTECTSFDCSLRFGAECMSCTKTECTSCTVGYFVKNGGCTEDCGSGYFPDLDKCYKCPSSCKECDASGSCTECSGELVLQNGQCEQCSSGTHFENGACVKDCPENCDSCTSADSCDTCAEGYLKEGGECVTDCSSGSYADGNTCKACDSSCSTCSGSGACDTCAEGLIKQGSSCVSGCDSGYYQDGDSCKACGDNCNVCDSASSCRTCASGFVEQQGTCRSKCDDGWTDMGGWCNRTSYSPNEAAPLLTNDNNNSFTIIFKK